MRNPYDYIGRIGVLLAVVGAINWLLVGLFEYNLVADIFGSGTQDATTGARVVYTIVGIGGIIAIPMLAATLGRGRRSTGAYVEDRDVYRDRAVGEGEGEDVTSERRRAA